MNHQPSTLNHQPSTALGYVRVSTDRQELSLEAQTSAIHRAAEYQQLGPATIFAEPDTSGRLPFLEREQGRALINRVRQLAGPDTPHLTPGTFVCTVIVNKVDRLGRDSVDVNQTVRLLDSLGARVVFLDINVDTRTPMGRAFMQIAAVFAELEVARIRERIQAALDEKRGQGLLTGTVPYGFNAVATGAVTAKGVKIRRLVDNPEEQKWILHMARLRSAGWGYHRIANELNRLGVPTKRGAGEIMKLRTAPSTLNPQPSTLRFTTGKWQCGNVQGVLTNATVQAWLKAETLKTEMRQAA